MGLRAWVGYAYLPASLFQSIANRTSLEVVYAVYDSGVLFPITNATEQVPIKDKCIHYNCCG